MLGQVELIEPDHTKKNRPYDSILFKSARKLKDLPQVQQALKKRINERQNATLRRSKARKSCEKLSKNERAFLDHLSLKEYEPINIIFSRVGDISSGAQQQIIKHLKKFQFIETVQERTGKMFIRFASLTNAGKKYLNK